MVFTHGSLCESMRPYPPVPVDGKSAENDDVLPDGTVVKKGDVVQYSPYAMGRMESGAEDLSGEGYGVFADEGSGGPGGWDSQEV
ncbi:hypothetical protein QYF36_027231 [Acer negundo]|nr:hypothetical protein QYF36_026601 [Acer negundo]KAK4849676.1 hypothetical protein QYF36_027231 [Acer negundo]